MAKVDLKIKAKDTSGNALTSTISYVNPALTNAQLSTLAHNLNGLTTNRYEEGQRVETVNIDSAPDKQTPTILTTLTVTSELKGNAFDIDARYTGNAPVYTSNNTSIQLYFDQTDNEFRVYVPSSLAAGSYTIKLYAPETSAFNALDENFVIQVQ